MKRETNKVAHGLADIGRKMSIAKAYHFQPPPNVRKDYEKELAPYPDA